MADVTPLVDIQTTERLLPYEVWHPMLLRRLDAMRRSDPERFNVLRIREENPELFQKLKAKSDEMKSFCYPTETEVLTYVAEFASKKLEHHKAAEIRTRAERRAGELLKATPIPSTRSSNLVPRSNPP